MGSSDTLYIKYISLCIRTSAAQQNGSTTLHIRDRGRHKHIATPNASTETAARVAKYIIYNRQLLLTFANVKQAMPKTRVHRPQNHHH